MAKTEDTVGLLNERQAAAFLGLTVRTLQSWRWSGKGPRYIRISARAVRYDPLDLRSYCDARKVSSTSEACA